jgi:hypothetical protein
VLVAFIESCARLQQPFSPAPRPNWRRPNWR